MAEGVAGVERGSRPAIQAASPHVPSFLNVLVSRVFLASQVSPACQLAPASRVAQSSPFRSVQLTGPKAHLSRLDVRVDVSGVALYPFG